MNSLTDVQQKMGIVAKFVLDHMNKPVTQLVQAEFNILYDQYHAAVVEAKNQGISEHDAIAARVECPVPVPENLYEKFDDWFCDRLVTMMNANNNPHNLN